MPRADRIAQRRQAMKEFKAEPKKDRITKSFTGVWKYVRNFYKGKRGD